MSAQLVSEMDTTETLPWVRDMQGLTEMIIELMASKCYTCVAPDGAMVEASHWSDVLGNPPASSLDSFLDKNETDLGYATHIASKTHVVNKMTDTNRKFMMADNCVVVPQLVARVLKARGVENVSVGELRFVYSTKFNLPAVRQGETGQRYRLLHHVTVGTIAGRPAPPHIVHGVLRVDGYAIDLLAPALGNSSRNNAAVWPVKNKFDHPDETGTYSSWRQESSAIQCDLLTNHSMEAMLDETLFSFVDLKPSEKITLLEQLKALMQKYV